MRKRVGPTLLAEDEFDCEGRSKEGAAQQRILLLPFMRSITDEEF
jgi:hypothetical protein